MITFMTRRQTERAGIDPTLSAVVAKEKGIASPKAINQHPRHIGEEYVDNTSNAFFYCLIYQVINHPTFETKIGLIYAIIQCQSRKSRIFNKF